MRLFDRWRRNRAKPADPTPPPRSERVAPSDLEWFSPPPPQLFSVVTRPAVDHREPTCGHTPAEPIAAWPSSASDEQPSGCSDNSQSYEPPAASEPPSSSGYEPSPPADSGYTS